MPRPNRTHRSDAIPQAPAAEAGAALAITNAERLLSSAEAVARHGDFASAASLMVLACEEAEKAYVLGMLGIGVDPTIIGAEAILSRHKARHDRSIANNLGLAMSESAVEHARDARRLESSGSLPNPAEMRRRYLQAVADGAARHAPDTPRGDELRRSKEWLSRANEIKQRGLYVDWVDGEWQLPWALGADAFVDGQRIASHIVSSRRSLVDTLSGLAPGDRADLVDAIRRGQEMLEELKRANAG